MKKRHLRVLKRIQDSIPAELLRSLTKKENAAAVTKEIVTRALAGDGGVVLSPADRQKFNDLLKGGYLDREVEVIDYDVERQIDEIFQREIDKAVRLGLLPKKAPTITLTKNKGKQYARKQNARLKAVVDAASPEVAHAPTSDSAGEAQ